MDTFCSFKCTITSNDPNIKEVLNADSIKMALIHQYKLKLIYLKKFNEYQRVYGEMRKG